DLNVVVFDSVNRDFYLAHYDVENDLGRSAALGVDVLVRLARVPVVSIASIRGRARGAGSEFVLACDLRFASRENTLLGQWEVGAGAVPGDVFPDSLRRGERCTSGFIASAPRERTEDLRTATQLDLRTAQRGRRVTWQLNFPPCGR